MRTLLLLLLCLQIHAQSAIWKNFGPSQNLETAAKLCLDSIGNIYYLANGDTNQFPGNKWQLYKLDSQGQVLWKQTYGTIGNFSASQIIYYQTKLYVIGERNWNDTTRAWVSVMDTSGAILQQKFFGAGDTTVVGQDIAFNEHQEIAILNQIRVSNGAPPGAQVLILDSNLNVLARHIETDSLDMVSHEIAALPGGSWVYTSDYELPNRFDILVVKINRKGQLTQRKVISNGYTRGGNAIDVNSKGQIAIGGEGASAFSVSFDITLTLLDTNLNVLADVFVRPGAVKNDACFDMAVSPYDTYLFTGYWIDPENGETEMIVVESDSAGNRLHIDRYGSSSTCIGSGIICDDQGKFIAAGSDFNAAPSLIIGMGQAKGIGQAELELEDRLAIYPNPSQGEIWLDGDFIPQNWQIIDIQSRLVPFEFETGKLSFDGPQGIYFLQKKDLSQNIRLVRN